MRLAKYLAHAGVASRRTAESMIAGGRVRVAGTLIRDPAFGVEDGDEVTVDGGHINVGGHERVVYVLHKPPGVVSTARDPGGRTTVVDLVDSDERLYPVGRLDADATGLILLTNDGELAHSLTHPSFEVPKTYRVVVRNAPVKEPALKLLREGVKLHDGMTLPARVRRITGEEIELTIREGRKRQIKRMCEAVGHRTKALQRITFGGLKLGPLPEGGVRKLSVVEVDRLRAVAAGPVKAEVTAPTAGPVQSRRKRTSRAGRG